MLDPALDLRRLRYFTAVARLGSVSAAARSIGVAQPALTLHISKLEQAFSIALFERQARGMVLTEAGRALLKHAETILAAFEEADRTLRQLGKEARRPGELEIAMVASLAEALASRLIPQVQKALPWLRPRLRVLRARECEDHIDRGLVDIALTVADPDTSPGEALISDPLFLVSAPRPRRTSQTIDFEKLAGLTLLVPSSESNFRRTLEGLAARAGFKFQSLVEIDGLTPRKAAVLAGVGATILPWLNVFRECAAGQVTAQRIVKPDLRRVVLFRHREGLDRALVTRARELLSSILLADSAGA